MTLKLEEQKKYNKNNNNNTATSSKGKPVVTMNAAVTSRSSIGSKSHDTTRRRSSNSCELFLDEDLNDILADDDDDDDDEGVGGDNCNDDNDNNNDNNNNSLNGLDNKNFTSISSSTSDNFGGGIDNTTNEVISMMNDRNNSTRNKSMNGSTATENSLTVGSMGAHFKEGSMNDPTSIQQPMSNDNMNVSRHNDSITTAKRTNNKNTTVRSSQKRKGGAAGKDNKSYEELDGKVPGKKKKTKARTSASEIPTKNNVIDKKNYDHDDDDVHVDDLDDSDVDEYNDVRNEQQQQQDEESNHYKGREASEQQQQQRSSTNNTTNLINNNNNTMFSSTTTTTNQIEIDNFNQGIVANLPRPSWHSEAADQEHRRAMILEIARLLQGRKKVPPSQEWLQQLPHKAQKLEGRLYQSAPSLESYLDKTTLKHRLQHLAQSITNQYIDSHINKKIMNKVSIFGGDNGRMPFSKFNRNAGSSVSTLTNSVVTTRNNSILSQESSVGDEAHPLRQSTLQRIKEAAAAVARSSSGVGSGDGAEANPANSSGVKSSPLQKQRKEKLSSSSGDGKGKKTGKASNELNDKNSKSVHGRPKVIVINHANYNDDNNPNAVDVSGNRQGNITMNEKTTTNDVDPDLAKRLLLQKIQQAQSLNKDSPSPAVMPNPSGSLPLLCNSNSNNNFGVFGNVAPGATNRTSPAVIPFAGIDYSKLLQQKQASQVPTDRNSPAGGAGSRSTGGTPSAANNIGCSKSDVERQKAVNAKLQQQIVDNIRLQEELVRRLQTTGADGQKQLEEQRMTTSRGSSILSGMNNATSHEVTPTTLRTITGTSPGVNSMNINNNLDLSRILNGSGSTAADPSATFGSSSVPMPQQQNNLSNIDFLLNNNSNLNAFNQLNATHLMGGAANDPMVAQLLGTSLYSNSYVSNNYNAAMFSTAQAALLDRSNIRMGGGGAFSNLNNLHTGTTGDSTSNNAMEGMLQMMMSQQQQQHAPSISSGNMGNNENMMQSYPPLIIQNLMATQRQQQAMGVQLSNMNNSNFSADSNMPESQQLLQQQLHLLRGSLLGLSNNNNNSNNDIASLQSLQQGSLGGSERGIGGMLSAAGAVPNQGMPPPTLQNNSNHILSNSSAAMLGRQGGLQGFPGAEFSPSGPSGTANNNSNNNNTSGTTTLSPGSFFW